MSRDVTRGRHAVTRCHSREEKRREESRKTSPRSARGTAGAVPASRRKLISIALAIIELWGQSPKIKPVKSRAFRRAGELLAAFPDLQPETLKKLYGEGGWWRLYDWRGKRNNKPTPEDILYTITDALAFYAKTEDRSRFVSGEYAEYIKH